MTDDLLRLLRATHPGRSDDDLRTIIAATPDASRPAEARQRPRTGSRPRTPESITRRRSWAAAGWMPPQIQARVTTGEAAVMAVIAVQVARVGACTLTLDHIGALAGVGRSTVKRALAVARELALVHVEERRQTAFRNLPHKITIIDPRWIAWLRMRTSTGVHFRKPTSTESIQETRSQPSRDHCKGFRRAGARPSSRLDDG